MRCYKCHNLYVACEITYAIQACQWSLEWVIIIIFLAQVFFGSIWGPKQLGQIWGRSLVTRLSAMRFNFVWDLVWENLHIQNIASTNYRFTPKHKSLNDFYWKFYEEQVSRSCLLYTSPS